MIAEPQVGERYDLPAGHGWQMPACTVEVVAVKPGEWVAYKNDTVSGCSRLDYWSGRAVLSPKRSTPEN